MVEEKRDLQLRQIVEDGFKEIYNRVGLWPILSVVFMFWFFSLLYSYGVLVWDWSPDHGFIGTVIGSLMFGGMVTAICTMYFMVQVVFIRRMGFYFWAKAVCWFALYMEVIWIVMRLLDRFIW